MPVVAARRPTSSRVAHRAPALPGHSRGARCVVWLGALVFAGPATAEVPLTWDVETGHNVRFSVELGTFSYAGPVVVGDRVLVGTNNDPVRGGLEGDRGVLLALSATDGSVEWLASHPKLGADEDYPLQGVCSTPAVVRDRVYYVSNDARLWALDLEGFGDGENDGPHVEEPAPGPGSADVVWSLDLRAELGVVPHYMSASTPAVEGDRLFVLTGNGADDAGHVRAPEAPSLVAVDRLTGEILWSDASPGADLVDGQWSSALPTDLGGRRQVIYGGGDGRLYGLAPDDGAELWRFDGNETAGHEARDRNAFVASPVVHGNSVFIAMGRDPEVGSSAGSLWALGFDETGRLDPSVRWRLGDRAFDRSIATVRIADGILYAADLSGYVVALDPESGAELWRHDTFAGIWGVSEPIDGRLYIGDTDGDVTVLEAGREKKVVAEMSMPAPIYRAPVAVGETLYLLTSDRLYALEDSTP